MGDKIDRDPEIGRTLTRIRSVLNDITEWILAPFVGCYIAGLVSERRAQPARKSVGNASCDLPRNLPGFARLSG